MAIKLGVNKMKHAIYNNPDSLKWELRIQKNINRDQEIGLWCYDYNNIPWCVAYIRENGEMEIFKTALEKLKISTVFY